jgi:guanylate kinase
MLPAGKLPLLQLEAEGAEALKAKGVDCLAVFLMPPSQEVHEARVRRWLAESDTDIAARQVGVSLVSMGRALC